MILVFSHEQDEHHRAVAAALDRLGAAHALLDTARFPQEVRVALAHGAGADGAVALPDGAVLRSGEVRAVWWRRPRPYAPHPERAAQAAFVARACHEALMGFCLALPARWVNHPTFDQAATHKPYQLALAERAGLPVPPTVVTNDPARARAFVEARPPGAVVHKTLSATADDWRPTSFVGPEERAALDGVRFAPVVFQEYVEGADVRVTLVGDRLFATEIDARATRSPHDFRPVFDEAAVRAVELPVEVEERLRHLVAELRLSYAAVDLRRTPAGEHLFLEVNPAGQWLFVEQRTGQPIAAALAELLAGKST